MVQESYLRRRSSFEELLLNFDDPVFVRELLSRHVSEATKQRILHAYNEHVDQYNERVRRQSDLEPAHPEG